MSPIEGLDNGYPMLESKFKRDFQLKAMRRFDGLIFVNVTPQNNFWGIPDSYFFFGPNWGALESKRSSTASRRVHQEYYVNLLNSMSYARFLHPGNEKEILDEMEYLFSK